MTAKAEGTGPEIDHSDSGRRWVATALSLAMVRSKTTYSDLSAGLTIFGLNLDEQTLRRKLGRGDISATFFVQRLSIMRQNSVRIDLLAFENRLFEEAAAAVARKGGSE